MASFDGINKIITITNGTTSISATELYSEWKEWLLINDNLKFLPAFRTVGGDPIGSGLYVSSYYFLMNGWRIRPYEGNHTLNVSGNLYVDGGGSPFIPTLGNYNVSVILSLSSDSKTTIVSTGSAVTEQDKLDIVAMVWDKLLADHQLDGSAGKALSTASSGGVDPDTLASAIWDRPLSNHTTSGTFGEFVQKKLLSVAKFIGLK